MLILSAKDAASLAKPKSMGRRKEKIFRLKARHPLEWEEQEWWFNWLAASHPDDFEICHANYAGGKENIGQAVKAKRTGRKAGVPDVFCPIPISPYHGLYIEFKRRCDSVISAIQAKFMDLLTKQGYKCFVSKGWEPAAKIYEDYKAGRC